MSDPQWSVAGGGYEAVNDLGGDIRSTVGKLLEIDQAVYSQAHETYLHMSAERAAAIRQSAERLERLLVDEAKAAIRQLLLRYFVQLRIAGGRLFLKAPR